MKGSSRVSENSPRMNRRRTCLVLCAAMLLAVCCLSDSLGQGQTTTAQQIATLNRFADTLADRSGDLIEMRPVSGGDDYHSATLMAHIASSVRVMAESVASQLELYRTARTAADRAKMRPIINRWTQYCAKRIGSGITILNSDISTIGSPGLAATGTQLRDDLRRLKVYLESLKLK